MCGSIVDEIPGFGGGKFKYNLATKLSMHYNAGAQRIAMQRGSDPLTWLIGDHLGSASVSYVAGGTATQERYKAWGEWRYGAVATEYKFTGQFKQQAIGLYWYGSRWYDPALGRFTQPDTIIPEPYNPLDYDRYQYARSNPLKYVDPDGHNPLLIVLALIAAVAFFSQIPSDQPQTDPSRQGDPAVMVPAAAVMLAPVIVPAACLNDGDCTNEALAVGQAAEKIGDPTDEINVVSEFAQADMPAVEEFVQNAGQINSARGYGSFGSTWKALVNSDSSGVFVNRVGDKITGMMKVGISSSGQYQIKFLEGIGSGAGTSLFKQAIMDSMAKGYGGSILLWPTQQALQWYLENFPGAQLLENGYLYWSSEAAQKLLR